jgi:hypothetical protein
MFQVRAPIGDKEFAQHPRDIHVGHLALKSPLMQHLPHFAEQSGKPFTTKDSVPNGVK